MKRVVLYVNQSQLSDGAPLQPAPVLLPAAGHVADTLNHMLVGGRILNCLTCSESALTTNRDHELAAIAALLDGLDFDLLLTAPAFLCEQYGICCAEVCHYVHTRYGIPVVTCMHEENPGVRLYPRDMYTMVGSRTADSLSDDLGKIAAIANKLMSGEPILWAEAEGYFPRGIRRQTVLGREESAARRAVTMLKDKLAGRAFLSELPVAAEWHVPISPAISDPKQMRLAFINTGGLVPAGNPDHLPCAASSRYGRYDIRGRTTLFPREWIGVDSGLDASYINEDPLLLFPLDALRLLEGEGRIGYLHSYFYSTTGNQTSQENSIAMAKEIAGYLLADAVNAVILVSCCGTGTRCGAMILNELETRGITTVQVANMVPVCQSYGVNRIVKGYSIPAPTADPNENPVVRQRQRYLLMEKALQALATPIVRQTVFE